MVCFLRRGGCKAIRSTAQVKVLREHNDYTMTKLLIIIHIRYFSIVKTEILHYFSVDSKIKEKTELFRGTNRKSSL